MIVCLLASWPGRFCLSTYLHMASTDLVSLISNRPFACLCSLTIIYITFVNDKLNVAIFVLALWYCAQLHVIKLLKRTIEALQFSNHMRWMFEWSRRPMRTNTWNGKKATYRQKCCHRFTQRNCSLDFELIPTFSLSSKPLTCLMCECA